MGATTETRASRRKTAVVDDADAITPCPPSAPAEPSSQSTVMDYDRSRTRSSSPESFVSNFAGAQAGAFESRRRDSVKTLEEGTEGDPERLWKRMLALQSIYGCYRSARMSAALELGETSLLQPSKACLDLLNDHIDLLPDEAEEVLKKTSSYEDLGFNEYIEKKQQQMSL